MTVSSGDNFTAELVCLCILLKASIALAFECSHVVISSFLSHLSGLTDERWQTVGEPVKCIAPAWQYSILWSPNEPEFLFCWSDALSPAPHKCQEKQMTVSEFFKWRIRVEVSAAVLYFYLVTSMSTTVLEICLDFSLSLTWDFKCGFNLYSFSSFQPHEKQLFSESRETG